VSRVRRRVGYRWHLRRLMAERGLFQTTELVPLLAERGVSLSREQVYRLAAKTPERLSLVTLAALCDILDCAPGDLIECYRDSGRRAPKADTASRHRPRPRRARVARDPQPDG
jgi:DNA-binding Xre family transcriptional regulator